MNPGDVNCQRLIGSGNSDVRLVQQKTSEEEANYRGKQFAVRIEGKCGC